MDAGAPPGMPLPGMDLPPGTWVGRYLVLHPLGAGATGAVYAVHDSELDRRVALKFLRHRVEGAEAEEWRVRLLREAKAMARLSHPNVVTLYDVGLSSEGRVFLAMEVVEGGTLGDWLRGETRSWRQIVSMLCEAGEGLAAAHRAGMIHRDFKLANVLFGKDGRPRVTDFGLARGSDEAAAKPDPESAGAPDLARTSPIPVAVPPSLTSSSSLAKMTLTGTIMGTPGYMAPEQYSSAAEIDARADVFAFCATLYRALYGERAFKGGTIKEIAESTILGAVREPPRGTAVPPWVHKVVLWGLATDREARPASMGELLAALRADPSQRRRRWLVAAGGAAATCAVALSVHAAGERRVRECHDAWRIGSAAPGTVREKRRSGEPSARRASAYADDTWKRVEARLDSYAGVLDARHGRGLRRRRR